MKVKAISLPYIFQVMYVLCFTRPRYQVSVYRTIGPLVIENDTCTQIVSAEKPVTQRMLGRLHEDKLTKLMNGVIREKLQVIPKHVSWGGRHC